MPDSLLETPEIDYVVMGEGERAITELASFIMKRRFSWRIKRCRRCMQEAMTETSRITPKFIENMDEIPYPARHLLPLELYDRTIEFLEAKPADVMSISRGCIFNCGFCETLNSGATSAEALVHKELWTKSKTYSAAMALKASTSSTTTLH